MKTYKARRIKIKSVCELERSVKNKVYKKGTCYMQMSAVSGTRQIWHLLDCDSHVTPGKYMMFLPKEGTTYDGEYLYIMLEKEVPDFIKRYCTTMNIQKEAFDHLSILWITDDAERREYVMLMHMQKACIDQEKKLIESVRMFKKVMMSLMFPS